MVVLGPCDHANKCLTCRFWLTSIEDLPALKTFHGKALRLRRRAREAGNPVVVENQDRIIPILALRIESLEETQTAALSNDELVDQLRAELIEVKASLDEASEAGIINAEKYLERRIEELQASIAEMEEIDDDPHRTE